MLNILNNSLIFKKKDFLNFQLKSPGYIMSQLQ